jgi:RNA polymerase sigma factor (sigma-70 family)
VNQESSQPFPETRDSIVRGLRSDDVLLRQRAFGTLAASYWKPVYKYMRLRWNLAKEEAEDLTQDFFTAALDREFLSTFDASRARFRTFLRTCVDRTVIDARRAATRIKRGGGVTTVNADFLSAEDELRVSVNPHADMDEFFRQECIRAIFELAVNRLREECTANGKDVHFAIFERYDVHAPSLALNLTYRDLALEFALPETQVTNFLAYARRRLRHHVLAVLAELTVSDAELADEAREIFGVELT